MLRSMTGFGSAQASVQGVEYAVEVRSVNNRYFKGVIKLPESLSSLEAEIEKILRKEVYRGTVTLAVRMRISDDQRAYKVNTAALASYIDQLRVLEVEANPTMRIDLGQLLQLPGVCEPPPVEEMCERTREGLMALVVKTLDELRKMRDADGKGLKDEFTGHCKLILQRVDEVAARAPQVVRDYQERLTARVKDLTAAARVEIDAESLAREVAVFAERCDVAEEVSRLRTHVEQFLATMNVPEPSGRKLDFIAQEMLREANTIGSKANDATIAQAVVDIKTAIDRIKEQAQNVE